MEQHSEQIAVLFFVHEIGKMSIYAGALCVTGKMARGIIVT